MGRGLIRAGLFLLPSLLLAGADAAAATLPPIIATADNAVPGCVTPPALMQFVAQRNARQYPPPVVDPRFRDIASLYQEVGQCVALPPQQCVGIQGLCLLSDVDRDQLSDFPSVRWCPGERGCRRQ